SLTFAKDLTFSLSTHNHDTVYKPIGYVPSWSEITGKPSTFTPSAHTHTIANVTGLQGALDSKATPSDISTAIDNLEIGGRNLLLNSGIVVTNANYNRQYLSLSTPTIIGQTYTFSLKCDDIGGANLAIYDNTTVSTGKSIGKLNRIGTSNVFAITFEAVDAFIEIRIRNNGDTTVPTTTYAAKLEKGNKATDWTPAPEDQVSDWSESNASSFSFIKNKPTLLSQFTDNIGVGTHIANKSNPHAVTKAQVGLGNVDNVKQATKSEFDTHTGNTTVHITSNERTNWNIAYANNHTHGNKSVIDALTQGHIDVLNKLSLDAQGNVKVDATLWATGELSAYGLGEGGGGTGYERLDAWADYDSTKSGWVLSALLGVDLNSRLSNVESGSATSITTTGSGNAITSVSKSGNTLTFTKESTFSLSTHNHDTVYKPIGYVPSWSEITGKPSTFTPSSHTHTIANVTGLQSALDGKEPTIPTGTTSQYYRGDKTWQTLNTSVVPEGTNLYFTNARVKAYGDTLYSPLWHTHTIAQITGLQGALDLKATQSDIDTAIDAIEIGGRNLLRNSKKITTFGRKYLTDSSKTITISFDLEMLDDLGDSGLLAFYIYGDGTNLEMVKYPIAEALSGRYSLTISENEPIFSIHMYTDAGNTGNQRNFIYHNFKVEKGNKATDWTPAPEDQVSDWNETDEASFSYIKNKPTQLSQFTDNIGVASHIANKANPHNVTKAQVGLSNVDNTADSAKNVLSATKLTTARTIAGVSFDGTANIAIPFANLSSKPTTLAGYGITDAVTLNTAQTITGAKTFSALLTASAGTNTPKVDFGNGFTVEPSGTELVFKYNGVIKQRMLSDGSFVAVGEITAYS
ncbi:MAG TPA: hypothetical protein VJY12_08805, partial [Dysgonamonadaceae bacterium]|nr:hypothetical protein [Dysgonamonadaceae bacterium]